MRLTLEANGEKIIIDIEGDDHDTTSMAQYLRQLLLGAGYGEQNVREILPEE